MSIASGASIAMANKEHLEILKQGVSVWNSWRAKYPGIKPDLSMGKLIGADMSDMELSGATMRQADLNNANLSRAYLNEADLSEANLNWTNLRGAYLHRANLQKVKCIGAYLIDADLSRAHIEESDLSKANLRGAYMLETNLREANLNKAGLNDATLRRACLRGTNLSEASLSGASLYRADLSYANLSGADLSRTNFGSTNRYETDFTKAEIGWTTFGAVDLSVVRGLDEVYHHGPSTVGIDTIYLSNGNISEIFLQGIGAPNNFIEFIVSVHRRPFQFYSCFISYSSKNQIFAEHLYEDLQNKGVRCWFASEDPKIGAKIRTDIDESIKRYDKLLLVLSRESVNSDWVEQEVETALAREHEEKRLVLFPVRIDNTVMQINTGWPSLIKNTRNIGDFTKWNDQESYENALDRLMRDLNLRFAHF